MVSSFSAVWWAEIVEKPSSRPNHLWFRLTLTVKLDHHQWTQVTRWQKEMRWNNLKISMRCEKQQKKTRWKSNGIKFLLSNRSRDQAKGSIDCFFILTCVPWIVEETGRVIVIRLLCPLMLEKFIFEASGTRSWKESFDEFSQPSFYLIPPSTL